MRTTRLLIWLIVLALVPIVVLASWAGTEYLIGQASDEAFCTTCHTMEAMGASYAQTKHGGNNRLGIKVKCADCHLPQDSRLNYIYSKAKFGLRDMWLQLTYDENNPTDWKAKRKNRHEYVFDSACTKCHYRVSRRDIWYKRNRTRTRAGSFAWPSSRWDCSHRR